MRVDGRELINVEQHPGRMMDCVLQQRLDELRERLVQRIAAGKKRP